MAAADLDVLVLSRFRLNAGLPGHDAVPPGVHGRGRNADRPGGLVAGRQPPVVRVQVAAAAVGAIGAALPRVGQGERAAQGDHLADQPGVLARQFPGVDPAQAPAHHRHRPAGAFREGRQGLRKPVQHGVGRAHIAPEFPAAHVMAQPAQEPPEQGGAHVGGQQPRDDQHAAPVAARRRREPRRGQRQDRKAEEPAGWLGEEEPGRRRLHRVLGARFPDEVHGCPLPAAWLCGNAKPLIHLCYLSHRTAEKCYLSGCTPGREVRFMSELPKGPSGKILKAALREG